MVLAMVGLRVVVGWHFFSEGLNHKNDPKWSSEGFLRAAKGPFAKIYRDNAPGLHGYYALLAVPLPPADDEPAPAEAEGDLPVAKPALAKKPPYDAWYTAIVRDWTDRTSEISNQYRFTDEQKGQLGELLKKYDQQLQAALGGNKESAGFAPDMQAFRHQLYRNQQMESAAGAEDIPNLAARMKKRDANPTGEQATQIDSSPGDWQAAVKAFDTLLEQEALALRTDEQKKIGPMPEAPTEMKKMDTVVTWLLIIGGACLLVGLLTRLSALALALFLASVVFSQPFWVADAVKTTYFEWTELMALLVLATSPVGRWAGLDFFIHHILFRPFRSR